jgi:hypothetical protein
MDRQTALLFDLCSDLHVPYYILELSSMLAPSIYTCKVTQREAAAAAAAA